jgi:hypothetical protein
MATSSSNNPAILKETHLPQRDWILLPAVSLLTIGLMVVSIDLMARRMFTSIDGRGEDCMVFNDPSTGARGIPNCVCREKIPESELTEYRFNSSGYRDIELAPKSPGTYRIVMIGTSVAAGFRVPRERAFATLLPAALSRGSGRKVTLYDEGLPWRSPELIARHFNDVLTAEPDMILWVLTPSDIERTSWVPQHSRADNRSLSHLARTWHRLKTAFATKSFTPIEESFSQPLTLLRNLLYSSQSQYVKSSLFGADYTKRFLESKTTVEWRRRLEEFDSNAATIEGRSRNAGIPLAVVLVPDRTQAAMISMMGQSPAGFDPYKLDVEVRSIIESHGGTYIDIFPGYRTIPNPHLGYFPVDGHPNAEGHMMISRFLAKELTGGATPMLAGAPRQRAALEQKK